jgi:hypothetical protein
MQTKIPNVMEAHLGILQSQSAQDLFSGFLSNFSRITVY